MLRKIFRAIAVRESVNIHNAIPKLKKIIKLMSLWVLSLNCLGLHRIQLRNRIEIHLAPVLQHSLAGGWREQKSLTMIQQFFFQISKRQLLFNVSLSTCPNHAIPVAALLALGDQWTVQEDPEFQEKAASKNYEKVPKKLKAKISMASPQSNSSQILAIKWWAKIKRTKAAAKSRLQSHFLTFKIS